MLGFQVYTVIVSPKTLKETRQSKRTNDKKNDRIKMEASPIDACPTMAGHL
jgi:hypothetical protein